MRKREIISALVFLAAGGIYIAGSSRLSFGTAEQPGPGFIPTILGLVMIVLSALYLVPQILRGTARGNAGGAGSGKQEGSGGSIIPRKSLAILVGLALFVLAFKPLGFLLTSISLLFAMFRITGYRNWAWSLGVAVISTAISYLLFVTWLKVPLPDGFLESLLFGVL